jgi:uncharacterized membrane protein (UPF0127 family)
MKIIERVIMVLLLFSLLGGGAWIYFSVKHERQEVRDSVARGEYQIPDEDKTVQADKEEWRSVYPNVVPLIIGTVTVKASVADSLPERIKCLSKTPFLPEGVVKLFAFNVNGEHSIWMKDMNYALDIIWISKAGEIVHIEQNITPETFPESFSSPIPAWYVIETNAGFTASNTIEVGDLVLLGNN